MPRLFILIVLVLSFSTPAKSDIRMPKIFCPDMVLQRDTTVAIWGWGDPGEKVTITLAGQVFKTTTSNDGNWNLNIGPYPAGGPYDMVIQGKNQITISNILFGEIWFCGGQSNMQFTLRMLGKNPSDLPDVNNQKIRLFQTELAMDYLPREDIKGGRWVTASESTVADFSATAYYYGRYLYDSLKVPIGLISSNLGATSIETWMSNSSLKQFPQFAQLIENQEKRNKTFDQLNRDLIETRKTWDSEYYLKGPGIEQAWYQPETDISDWKSISLPNFWEYEGLEHDGAVWFRKKFDLPAEFESDSFQIHLNQIDDYDITWVNGVKVGESFGNRNFRSYSVPANILKDKGNELVIRVFDIGELGGIYTSAFWGNPILTGEWKYRVGLSIDSKTFPKPDVPNGSIFSYPSLLFNGNVAPFTRFTLKGAIWYQGESNASRAIEYAQLLPAMIQGWRSAWGSVFPFLIVQLANYMEEPTEPVESTWAELREAQQLALSLPKVFVATAVDIGDSKDIHPKNKETVGQRLGMGALKTAYNWEISAESPQYQSMQVTENSVQLNFDQSSVRLTVKDKFGYIRGFQIAGQDRKFHWAKAFLKDGTVTVSSDNVLHPVAVRYAWADNPGPLDLYGENGLPVLPFRTDNWPLSTAGKVYVDNPHQF